MANIVSDQTDISMAESVSNWSGDSFSLENEIFVEGSNSVAVIQTANGVNDVIYSGGPWNMSGQHLRMFMSSNIMPNTGTIAADGIQLWASDGGNTAYFTVGGSDTYSGGWADFFVDIDSSPTTGSVNSAAVTSVGIRINTTSKPRNSTNGWYDNWRFGNGVTINSSASEAISFQDVADADKTTANAWDILREADGVLFGKGKLTLGSTGSLNCNLVSTDETVYFVDRVVATDLYAIQSQESTGQTDINISGLVCKTVGSTGAEINFSSGYTSLSITGSTFGNMGNIDFGAGIVSSSTITGSNRVLVNGTSLTSSTISNTGETITGSLEVSGSSDFSSLSDITFVGYGANTALYIPASVTGSVTLNNFLFDNITATNNIYWAGLAGTLTINRGGTTNVATTGWSSGGGTVYIPAASYDFKFTVSPSFIGYEWRIYTVTSKGSLAGSVEVAGEEVSSIDNQTYSYEYSSDQDIAVQILSDTYVESTTYYTLSSGSQDITINLTVDNND